MRCVLCGADNTPACFSKAQRKKPAAERKCKTCTAGHGGSAAVPTAASTTAPVTVQDSAHATAPTAICIGRATTAVCAHCGTTQPNGKQLRCAGCSVVQYCGRACQKAHWKRGNHRQECRPAAVVATAATASAADLDATAALEPAHPCPICFAKEDDYVGDDGSGQSMCYVCGQQWCGNCENSMAADGFDRCPTCRAPKDVSAEQDFQDLKNMVETREPGRHIAIAQYSLGRMYDNGEGVAEDKVEAVRLYTLAADQNHADAQYNLGLMYDNGEGVAEDKVEAVRLYTLAADQNHAAAQCNLGRMYDNGEGVAEDKVEAVRLYTLAADQNHAYAQYNLGRMYANGEGVAEDKVEAVRLYTLAADQNHATAQYNLGWMYANGEGVAEDKVEAVRLYTLAADQNHATPSTTLAGCTPTARVWRRTR